MRPALSVSERTQLTSPQTIAFNLINETDLEESERRIKKYELENRQLIEANLTRAERDAELVRLRDEAEQREKEEMAERYQRIDEEDRLAKELERAHMLEDLVRLLASCPRRSRGPPADLLSLPVRNRRRNQRRISLQPARTPC